MSRARHKQLRELADHLGGLPIQPRVVEPAFERFRESGELPEEQQLAVAVIERVQVVTKQNEPKIDLETNVRNIARLLDQIDAGAVPPAPEPFREHLFHEAVQGSEFVRTAARAALKMLVGRGGDITDAHLLDDVQMPDYGTVGLHLLGFPENLARPPYEDKARDVFARFAGLRERIDHTDKAWFANLARAGVQFRRDGELPDDDLLRETVQANAELLELIETVRDDDVVHAMARATRAGNEDAAKMLLCRVCTWARHPVDLAVGPPIPDSRTLFDQLRKFVELATEVLPDLADLR